MFSAIILAVCAILFRLLPIFAGGWVWNFSPLAAIALCGAAFLPKRIALVLPLVALLVSDVILNLHFHAALFDATMFSRYAALLVISGFGLLIRSRRRLDTLMLASLASSITFYVATNTVAWLT